MSSLSNDLLSLLPDKQQGGKRNILSKCTGELITSRESDVIPSFSTNTLINDWSITSGHPAKRWRICKGLDNRRELWQLMQNIFAGQNVFKDFRSVKRSVLTWKYSLSALLCLFLTLVSFLSTLCICCEQIAANGYIIQAFSSKRCLVTNGKSESHLTDGSQTALEDALENDDCCYNKKSENIKENDVKQIKRQSWRAIQSCWCAVFFFS